METHFFALLFQPFVCLLVFRVLYKQLRNFFDFQAGVVLTEMQLLNFITHFRNLLRQLFRWVLYFPSYLLNSLVLRGDHHILFSDFRVDIGV